MERANGEECDDGRWGTKRLLPSRSEPQNGNLKCDLNATMIATRRGANIARQLERRKLICLGAVILGALIALGARSEAATSNTPTIQIHHIKHNSNSNNNHHHHNNNLSTVIVDNGHNQAQAQQQQQLVQPTTGAGHSLGAAHLQPSFVYGARNKSVNFTHVLLDESTGSIYVGATNWLFQLSAGNLRPEVALRTGPASENSRDCAPADCLAHIAHVEAGSLPMQHSTDLQAGGAGHAPARLHNTIRPTMHTTGNASAPAQSPFSAPARNQIRPPPPPTNHLHNNNYNKILALDADSRQLIVCGSLSQGACRRHQLGQLANYSELIPLPVVANDEHSSSVALVTAPRLGSGQKPILYVAATNSRLGVYREMVPAISARYLEPASRAMQIIERSFTDFARVDISYELRDYYLVNYVYAFQHNDYAYFATVQRKSQLNSLEEWGYITRLARLCLSDLSFQSYTEMTLECNKINQQAQKHQPPTNYNLLQDAQLASASSHLAQQLGIRAQSPVLIGAFAQSKDHTTKSQAKSALCLFPMEQIEQKFSENIHMCYNGSAKARNMNYIAGSVNDCPKLGVSSIGGGG